MEFILFLKFCYNFVAYRRGRNSPGKATQILKNENYSVESTDNWVLVTNRYFKQTEMKHEKIFLLAIGREAKIIVTGTVARNSKEFLLDFEFLVRDTHEHNFHSPIGLNHPQYWKFKKSSTEKAQLLEMEYSGVSRKQLNEAVREFRQLIGPGFSLKYNIVIQERIKTLKGIRLGPQNRRLLAVI